jgi:hypothetical protein
MLLLYHAPNAVQFQPVRNLLSFWPFVQPKSGQRRLLEVQELLIGALLSGDKWIREQDLLRLQQARLDLTLRDLGLPHNLSLFWRVRRNLEWR